jgi:hypothetical protein
MCTVRCELIVCVQVSRMIQTIGRTIPQALPRGDPGLIPDHSFLSCVVGRMTLGQVFLRLLRFYPIIPPLLLVMFLLSEGQAGETWVSIEAGPFQILKSTGLAFILGWHCSGGTQTYTWHRVFLYVQALTPNLYI